MTCSLYLGVLVLQARPSISSLTHSNRYACTKCVDNPLVRWFNSFTLGWLARCVREEFSIPYIRRWRVVQTIVPGNFKSDDFFLTECAGQLIVLAGGLIVRVLVLIRLSWRVELIPTSLRSCYQASDHKPHELTPRIIDQICAITRVQPLDPLIYISSLIKARIEAA